MYIGQDEWIPAVEFESTEAKIRSKISVDENYWKRVGHDQQSRLSCNILSERVTVQASHGTEPYNHF